MTTQKLTLLIGLLGILTGATARFLAPRASPDGSGLPVSVHEKGVKKAAESWQLSLTSAMRLPPGQQEEAQVHWADRVPEADIPEAIRLLDARRDWVQLQVLLCRWAVKDPLAALAAWRSLPITVSRSMRTESVDRTSGGSGISPRSDIGAAILSAWSRRDPAAAGEWAKTVKGDARWRAIGWPIKMAIDRHPESPVPRIAADPSGEGARVLAMPHSDERTNHLRFALRVMADKDPATAAAWVDSWPAETRQRMGVFNLDWPLANAPASMRARLTGDQMRRLPPTELGKLLEWSGEYDPNAVVDSRLSAPTFTFTYQALREWTAEDPDQARAWVEAVESPELRGVLSGAVAVAMLERNDLTAAVAILDALPPDQHAAGLLSFVRGWARADAPAAAAWLNRVGDDAQRDSCLAAVTAIASHSDPVWALTQSSQIQDAAQRSKVQEEILRNQEVRATAVKAAWLALDPQAPAANQ